jgi:hypothetical protein
MAGATLHLVVIENSAFHVYVKTPSGTVESVECQAFDLVSAIKERLEVSLKVPGSQQWLIFDNISLKDDSTQRPTACLMGVCSSTLPFTSKA